MTVFFCNAFWYPGKQSIVILVSTLRGKCNHFNFVLCFSHQFNRLRRNLMEFIWRPRSNTSIAVLKEIIIRFPGCIHFPYQNIFEWISTKTGFHNSLSSLYITCCHPQRAKPSLVHPETVPVSISDTERNKKISKLRKNFTVVQT